MSGSENDAYKEKGKLHREGYIALEALSQHFKHANTNLAYPRTSAWFMKSKGVMHYLGDNVLFVLYSVPIAFVSKLVWAPISMMPLGFHPKVVTGMV
eukprot:727959-Pelagomonas_calceolata.AAC.1